MPHSKLRYLGIGLLLGITFGALTQARADGEPLHRIGIGADGESIDEPVDGAAYGKEFSAIIGSVSDSSLAALNRPATKNHWKLETLVVGVGVGMEFGVGPILKIKATPRLRVVFSKSADPVLP